MKYETKRKIFSWLLKHFAKDFSIIHNAYISGVGLSVESEISLILSCSQIVNRSPNDIQIKDDNNANPSTSKS